MKAKKVSKYEKKTFRSFESANNFMKRYNSKITFAQRVYGTGKITYTFLRKELQEGRKRWIG